MKLNETELIRGEQYIVCPICSDRAERVGAQDDCDVYVCEQKHLTRIKIGSSRKVLDGKT